MTVNTPEREKSRLNPIFLLVAALTVLAQWDKSLGVLRFLAELCRTWLALWREVWHRLFEWLEPYTLRTFPADSHDMITLITTLLATVGVGQILLSLGTAMKPTTTIDEVQRLLKAQRVAGAVVSAILIVGALAIVTAPFFNSLVRVAAEMGSESAAITSAQTTPAWIQDWMPWTAGGLMLLGGFISFYSIGHGATFRVFGFVLMSTGAASLSIILGFSPRPFPQQVDLALQTATPYAMVVLLPLWSRMTLLRQGALKIIGILCLSMYLLAPLFYLFLPALPFLDALGSPNSTLWIAFCAALSLIAARTALPLVQLAIIVVSVLALDVVASGALEIWTSVNR